MFQRAPFLAFVLLLASFASAPQAGAQVPPSPAEVAAYSGLHAASHAGDAAAIARLLAAGARPNDRDARGRTPLHVAAFARRHDAMRALVAGGADPRALEDQKYDAITIAAVADDLETMRLAIALGGDPRAITSPYVGTALIAAAHLGHVDIVRELIRAGAPLDHVNNLHWTALIEAVVLGDGGPRHRDCARLLIEAGARRDLTDRSGLTPLELARRRGFAEMAVLLER
jgi:ankyrin repeat protein